MSMIPRNLPSQAERDARRNAEYLAAYGERCPEHVARALLALYENTNSMGAHPEVGKLKSRYTRVGGDTVLRQARYWIRNTMREVLDYENGGLTIEAQNDQALGELRRLVEAYDAKKKEV